jgi:hypothetical protein
MTTKTKTKATAATNTITTTTVKKEQRVCSECGNDWTRIHHWNKNQLHYEQWYNNHQGGFFCYSCYMKKYWEKRKRLEKVKEKKEHS